MTSINSVTLHRLEHALLNGYKINNIKETKSTVYVEIIKCN